MSAVWTVTAVRYGTVELPASQLGLESDPHDGIGRLDYFVWVLRNGERTILVDTGFDPEEAARRGRRLIEHPAASLERLGIACDSVADVVLTHLHYDHAGNTDAFANARFHLQDAEMRFATGRCMCHRRMRHGFSVDGVVAAVRLVFQDRVTFHDGDRQLAPGVSLHLIGGHSRGLQVARVATARGPVVVASDALHLARYLDDGDAFPAYADYEDVIDGYRRLRDLAGPAGLILPGHDPASVDLYARERVDWADAVRIG